MKSNTYRWSSAISWMQERGFKVKVATPEGGFESVAAYKRRLAKQNPPPVTVQSIGGEGQQGPEFPRLTAQAIGAECQDGYSGPPLTAQAIGAEGQ
jgi:hypothetical protein